VWGGKEKRNRTRTESYHIETVSFQQRMHFLVFFPVPQILNVMMKTVMMRHTVRHRGMETGISEASKRVSIFSFATQGGKQVSFYF